MGTKLIENRQRGVNPERLTDQQEVFIREYVGEACFNGSEAARRAGYKNPGQMAGKLLKNPKIQAALGKLQRERMTRLDFTADRVLQELAHLCFRDVIDLCDERGVLRTDDINSLPEPIRRCIDGIKQKISYDSDGNETVECEIKLAPKLGALDLAMKHFALLSGETHEHNHKHVHLDWNRMMTHGVLPDEIEEEIENV